MENYSVDDLNGMKSRLESERDVLKPVFDSALFYYLPEMQSEKVDRNRSNISEENQPLDPIGQRASTILASGIFSNTISMGAEFFGFRANNEELNDNEEVKQWFAKASKECLRQMQNSNYSMMAYEALLYYCTLNTGVLYTGYEDEELVYKSFPITQCSIAEGKSGVVNTIFRSFQFTPQQAYERWGDNNAPEMIKAFNDPDKRFVQMPFYHVVLPRFHRDKEKKDNKNMEFASYYVDETNEFIVEESGYNNFPYAVPRFIRTSPTAYGRGPSFACLPTVREIDRLRADIIDGTELKLMPPVFLPAGSTNEDIDIVPGAVNYYNPLQNGQLTFYQPEIDIKAGQMQRADLKNDVMDFFFANLFMQMSDTEKGMTATEVNARNAEKAQALTPIVNRLYDEFFSPCITRTLMLLMEHGIIDQVPKALQGQEWKVEYTTRLSALLKQIESNSAVMSFEQSIGIYKASSEVPAINDVVDIDKLVKNIYYSNNVDPDIIRTEDETEELRAKRAEADAEAQSAMMMADKVAPIDMTKAPEEGSLLQDAQNQGLAL